MYLYRGDLPHLRASGAIYFVTWRLDPPQPELLFGERALVVSALRHFEGTRYDLLAFVVMNDHVHVLVTPIAGYELQNVVHSWKSFTAHALAKNGRRAPIWQKEYFDRIVRDEDELEQKRAYIAGNPARRWPDIGSYEWCWVKKSE